MKSTIGILALGLVIGGCASTAPRELVDARSAYQQAANNPNSRLAQTDLYEARQALDVAEKKFKDDGDEVETRDYAYVAQRKAIVADVRANTMRNVEAKKVAERDLQKWKDQSAVAMRDQLEATKSALGAAQQQTEAERRARAEADARAQQALAQIAGLKAQQSERGLVLTLSGSVLFETAKSTLIASAQTRLNDVAKALKEDKRNITIVGHTDSQGADDMNQRLSQSRADAVRNYLVKQGVPSDRIKAEGMGETQPVADNGTPEGRANNRRVEIILENNGGHGSSSSDPTRN